MLTRQDLVTRLRDQPVALIVEPLTFMVRNGGRLLQRVAASGSLPVRPSITKGTQSAICFLSSVYSMP